VSGKITAPDDSEFDIVFVELIEAPARVIHRVRARVGQSYRIPYSCGMVSLPFASSLQKCLRPTCDISDDAADTL
jgi:hypothetical protein